MTNNRMDDLIKCMFCEQPISSLSKYFLQEHNGIVRAGHMQCSGIDELIAEWGIVLRLQKITDQYPGE